MSQERSRYVQVGLGVRSWLFTEAIVDNYKDHAELVGFCDTNQGRMDLRNRHIAEKVASPVPTYKPDAFDSMIAETKPDVVIVTTGPDATHAQYICRAMELGCDVITEKPMTVDEASCRQILATAERTGRKLQVTFNYRYSPPRSQVREILASGAIGDIYSVDFSWLLDTRHGADYFRRWHRMRANSGSLLVHKSTHHFDLVNWWLADVPEDVYARGSRRFYTPATAERMGLADRSERCLDCPAAERCKFHLDLPNNGYLREMYHDNEAHDGYFRDRCVFADEIDIWDNMSVNVRYRSGALLNYMLHTYSPYEGYRIAFNGSLGRLEHAACESTYLSGDGTTAGGLSAGDTSITLIPAFSDPQPIEVKTGDGDHGGGDPLMAADIFAPDAPADPLGRKASQRDGAYSILVGIAAYHSIDSNRPVSIPDLLGDAPLGA